MKLYNSAYNIPLFNWEQFNRTHDAKYLIDSESLKTKDRLIQMFYSKHSVKLLTSENINDSYFSIYDEVLDLTEAKYQMEEWKGLVMEVMKYRAEALNDPSKLNFVNHYEELLNNFSGDDTVSSPIKNRMIVQKLYGLNVNPKEITLAEYIEITNIVKESNKNVKNSTDEPAN